MKREEKFSFLNKALVIQLNNHKLYTINYSNIERRFAEEIENYKNHPELISIDEFSMNYSFGYHSSNNIDDMYSKEAMFIEVKNYLETIKMCA
ncbi:hypothetical protein [uncultured Aquimarina sp.]|uniref:hypothetical protein n=1 Tax=uncultured Aquimarina sp. TaxID=575652 RepID=UPI00260F92B4|nr:hypothetical protein [uncultured Aquimarina sp.]